MTERNLVHTNVERFERDVIESDRPVLVDFWADWCGPCRAVAPTLDALADDFDGRAHIVKVDVDANPELARRYAVRSIPSLVFFHDGDEKDRVVGVKPKQELAERLEKLLAA